MAHTLFTYGSLVFPVVMQAVTGKTFSSCPGWVLGYERFRVRGEVFPGLVPSACRSVRGRVYLEVDEASLARLDRFEDWMYERRRVEVATADGPRLSAEAWIVPDRHAHLLERQPWDAQLFLRRDLPGYVRRCQAFRREDRRRFGG